MRLRAAIQFPKYIFRCNTRDGGVCVDGILVPKWDSPISDTLLLINRLLVPTYLYQY